jgi:hypothetical protein
MDVGIITGSRSTTDNVTSFYTFALGIMGGGYLAYFLAIVDLENNLKGDLVRIYLAITTAMLGGGIGLFASRLGDRISDRRRILRKVYNLRNNLQDARESITVLRDRVERYAKFAPTTFDASGAWLDFTQATGILVDIERVRVAVNRELDFDDLLNSEEDLRHARLCTVGFVGLAEFYGGKHFREFVDLASRQKEVGWIFHPKMKATLPREINELQVVEDYFTKRSLEA